MPHAIAAVFFSGALPTGAAWQTLNLADLPRRGSRAGSAAWRVSAAKEVAGAT